MNVVVTSIVDRCNVWFFEDFVKYHSQYADKIIMAIENFQSDFDLSPEQYEIAKKYDVEVYPLGFKWHEGKVWKVCIDKALKYNPKWIGVLGSDETFENKLIEQSKELFSNDTFYWYSFGMCHMWEDQQHYRVDGVWGISSQMQVKRFFRNCFSSYTLEDKEWHGNPIPGEIVNQVGKFADLRMKNCGYLKKGAWEERCKARGLGYGDATTNFGEIKLSQWKE